jgi:hypothetical protein
MMIDSEIPCIDDMRLNDNIVGRERNLDRVQKPVSKDIISHHAGCEILTNEVKHIPLLQESDLIKIQHYIHLQNSIDLQNEENIGNSNSLKNFFNQMGLPVNFESERFGNLIEEVYLSLIVHLNLNYSLSEEDLKAIFCKFHAPTSSYGQKIRKLSARGQLKDVIELVIRGCDANATDGDGFSALHYASELSRYEVVLLLSNLLGAKIIINCQDKYGWTPLHVACHYGNVEVVEALIGCGANATISDIYGKTPLHTA